MKEVHRQMRPLLGTYVEIGCYADDKHLSLSPAFAVIEKIQNLLSFHNPESDLSRLNNACGSEIALDSWSIQVLKLAKAVSIASKGLFNPTLGGEMQHLGYLPKHPAGFLKKSDLSVRYGTEADIEIKSSKARLRRPVKVVLDGIAKGYAVDRAVQLMKKNGFTAGWVNAGGDIRVFGDLTIPISRRLNNGNIETLGGLKDLAIATSSITNTFSMEYPGWILTDQKYSPEPGTYSVIARQAWRADALTKVSCLSPSSTRMQVIRQLGGCSV